MNKMALKEEWQTTATATAATSRKRRMTRKRRTSKRKSFDISDYHCVSKKFIFFLLPVVSTVMAVLSLSNLLNIFSQVVIISKGNDNNKPLAQTTNSSHHHHHQQPFPADEEPTQQQEQQIIMQDQTLLQGTNNSSSSSPQEECKVHGNISQYPEQRVLRNARRANCLNFNCSKDISHCDNISPTNYDGPEPPCCVHILRDMAQTFDEAMCNLGLDYVTGFGSLLGLVRGGRFIPWTIDDDYIIPSKNVYNAMVKLWDAKKTGLNHLFQLMPRMCITPDFANGQLKKWEISTRPQKIYNEGFPYIDLYVGQNVSSMFQDFSICRHEFNDVFPTKRVKVYNGTFTQNFPANPEQLIKKYYGKNWKTPRSDKSAHGSKLCDPSL